MKKRISIFICMMLAVIMTTGVVFATTKEGADQWDESDYNKQYLGSSSEFWARSDGAKAYVTIENTSTSSRYLTCQMREFTANIGWTDTSENAGTALKGVQVSTEIIRDLDIVGYYYHLGKCFVNQYTGVVLDTYSYDAYQWMTVQD